jgi:multiple antibiotic resistance protein
MVFTAFMVMLGPVKVIGPFARLTTGMSEGEARKIAGMALAFSCAGGVVAAVFGQNVLASWSISLAALHLAAGLVLLLVALKAVLAQYEPAPAQPSATTPSNFVLTPLTFPTILTPHGIAIFILLLAVTRDTVRDGYIIAIFFGVMLLNWLAMWFARAIIRRGGLVLLLMDTVFAVLQVALGIQISIEALRTLHVLPPP